MGWALAEEKPSDRHHPPRLRTSATGGPLPASEVARRAAPKPRPSVRAPTEPKPPPEKAAPSRPVFPKIGPRAAPPQAPRPTPEADEERGERSSARLSPVTDRGGAAKPARAAKPATPAESRRRTILGVVVVVALVGGVIVLPGLLRPGLPMRGPVSALFTREVRYWSDSIVRWSAQYGVEPNMIALVMQIESCGYADVVSPAGAQGLFQVMPLHFTNDEKSRMTDPETNARRGMGVFTDCLERAGGDVGLALACYNGGPSWIGQPFTSWPDETQQYYTWGSGIYNDVQRGAAYSATLERWLEAGGWTLCQRASAALGLPTATPFVAPVRGPTLPALQVTPVTLPPTNPPQPGIPTAAPPDFLPTFDASGISFGP